MDPTQEIKEIFGDMAMQIAVLQHRIRHLVSARNEFIERLRESTPEERDRLLTEADTSL